MQFGTQYVQFSKMYAACAGVAYVAQVIITMVLVCTHDAAASALLEILKTTTGLLGLIFGCYSGNSAVEKVAANKKAVDATMQMAYSNTDRNSGGKSIG